MSWPLGDNGLLDDDGWSFDDNANAIVATTIIQDLLSLMEHLPFFMSIDWFHNTYLVKSLNVYSMTIYEGIYITSIIYIIRETSLVLSKLVHYWSKHDYVARLQHYIMISLNLSIALTLVPSNEKCLKSLLHRM
jgi:hypothetical protein